MGTSMTLCFAIIAGLLMVVAIVKVESGISPDLLTPDVVFSEDFTCLGEAAKVIKFANNEDVVVPHGLDTHLPQVRLMMGLYDSQWAIHYIAFIYMREILGINVTFFPTIDPNKGWSGAASGYPENFWSWLADDKNDICFEFWPQQAALVQAGQGPISYYQSGAVDFGGFVGSYGEAGLWVPQYVVDKHPTIVSPSALESDQSLQDLLIQGSQHGSKDVYNVYSMSYDAFDGNYSKYFAERYDFFFDMTGQSESQRGENGMGVRRTGSDGQYYRYYDDPGNGKPTFWGTVPSYGMSKYFNNLTHNVLDDSYNFVCIESEYTASKIFSDLYSRRQPFVANIHNLDRNFAIRDKFAVNPDDDLQKWHKIDFARNPDQSFEDECFLSQTCQYPLAPLMKIANPLLAERFPEAYQFFQAFQIDASSINKLHSLYLDLEDAGLHNSERWLNASCTWLKNEADVWKNSNWFVNIERYDCLDGCAGKGSTSPGTCDYLTGTCIYQRSLRPETPDISVYTSENPNSHSSNNLRWFIILYRLSIILMLLLHV